MSKINSSEYDNIDPGFSVSSSKLSGGKVSYNGNLKEIDSAFGVTPKNVDFDGDMLVSTGNSTNGSVNGKDIADAKYNYGYTTLPADGNRSKFELNKNNGYSGIDSDMFVSSSGNGSSGVVSMNPKALYNTALNGVDLESRVNANFQHLDNVFEELIESVQTPELNSKLKSLYDTFRKVENDFDRNNQVINKFFEGQLQSYSEHAETISDAANNLSENIGFGDNGNYDLDHNVMPISGNSSHLTKDIWSTDPGAYRGSDKIGNSLGNVNSSKSEIVDIQPIKPVVEVQGSSNSSNLEPTKVYTYDEINGLKEATNVGHKSDYDLIHDTAFGVTPDSSGSTSSSSSSDSSSWTAYDGNKMFRGDK